MEINWAFAFGGFVAGWALRDWGVRAPEIPVCKCECNLTGFEPAPPRAFSQLAIPRPSASHLESFLPQRRRVKLAEQAETRRLRLEAAKVKRQITLQEHNEKSSKEVDRYLQRMDRFENYKRALRPAASGASGGSGGVQRRTSLLSFSLGQQLEERRKQFLQICAVAAFCHRATNLLDGFSSLSQVCLTRFNSIVLQEKGIQAKPFAKAAALMIWRCCYARVMRERLRDLRDASPVSPRSPKSPSSQSSPSFFRQTQEAHGFNGPLLRSMPLLEKKDVLQFLRRITFIEGVLEVRLRVRRKRAQAKCIHLMLQKWYPFAIQRMLRHVYGCVKRLQHFLRRALLRLKAIRVAVKAQMLQIEREQVEKELLEEEAHHDVKRKGGPKGVTPEQVNRALLPESWRNQILNSLLRQRRRQQLNLLQEWRVDMSTYHWEVFEWRKSNHQIPCPVMPAYPTHVPSQKVLTKLIEDARKLRSRRPSYLPDLALLHLAPAGPETWGEEGWHRRKADAADSAGQTDAFSYKAVEMKMPALGLEMPSSVFLR